MNQKQHSFVTEYLRIGDKVIAYKIAYQCDSTNLETLISSANRLMKHPEVAKAIEDVQSRIRAQVEYELKQELRRELLTVQRKRELLAAIATGDISVEQNYKGRDCKTCTQFAKPTINQMLKAIDIDSKLAGHYVSNKNVHDSTQPVKPVENTESTLQNEIADTQELDIMTEERLEHFLSPQEQHTNNIPLIAAKQYRQLE
ncbi:MAG: hypothetical protein H6551_01175 [Chitinophagales bacterium]|nr:hypothetical protein [Chitinophagaceae bacterium]MCB9063736.1 hypothetical protein [Chitinophagales bacterium]